MIEITAVRILHHEGIPCRSHILSAQAFNAPQHLCIHHLLQDQAQHTPDALAILAPGRAPLTYGRLHRHVDDVVQTLHAMGLGRNDRVALVLPNGPEMAVAFLAVAAGATCAPLNPAYSANEFDFYLADLHAQALIVQAGMDSPARAVAQAHGLQIIELSPNASRPRQASSRSQVRQQATPPAMSSHSLTMWR